MRFFKAQDPAEVLAMQAIADRTAELNRIRDKNLAVEIANKVGELFG